MPREPSRRRSRPLCYVHRGSSPAGSLVETCTRTVHGRPLLRPGPDADERIVGALGRAAEYYGIDVYGFAFVSTHYHLLYGAEHGLQMSRFQCHLNSNIAREIGRLHDWREKFWSRRYRPMMVSDEREAQCKRLKYVLKPLPAFKDDSPEEYRAMIAALLLEIEEEAAAERKGRPVLGVEKILAQDPCQPVGKSKKSPAPMLIFADSPDVRDAMRNDYDDFVDAYEIGSRRLIEAAAQGYLRGGVFPGPSHLSEASWYLPLRIRQLASSSTTRSTASRRSSGGARFRRFTCHVVGIGIPKST